MWLVLFILSGVLGAQQIDLTRNVRGILPQRNGGTGNGITANNTMLISTGSGMTVVTIPNCPDPQHLNYDSSSHTLSCGSGSGILPVTSGGTGVTTLTGIVEGHGTGAFTGNTGVPLQVLRAKINVSTPGYEFAQPPLVYARDYTFSQQPGGSIAIGANTVNLVPVPVGVNGADVGHVVYLSGGTGTAEAVTITGGTAISGNPSGSITFNAANVHTGAWTVSSATSGIQEAVISTGYYGGVYLGCGTIEVRAPIRVSYRTSLIGCGQDTTFLHNNSTTTGVINYTALTPPGDQATFGGVVFSGFTIYSGAKSNTAADTTIADAIYILGAGWGVTVRDTMVRNHAVGYHQVNGWSSYFSNANVRFFRDYGYLTEIDGTVGTGTEAGAGQGGDQNIDSSYISNVGVTGTPTDTGCGIRYANWSGLYLHHVSTTAAQYGLCLQPRALRGGETYSQIYYGQIDDSTFDTSVHDGILVDTTNGTTGGVTEVDFTAVKSAYNGCLQSQAAACASVPFANAANGIKLNAVGSNVIRGLRFIGGVVRENGGHGVLTNATAYVNTIKFIGMDADNNSQAADNTYDGFHFSAGNFQIILQGATSGSMNSVLTRHPRYGFFGDTALTQMQVSGNTFYPLNQTGPCGLNSNSNLNNFTSNYPISDLVCNATFTYPGIVGANVASASTITPSVNAGGVFHLTGTAAISTMNTPTNFPIGGSVCAIADGLWTMGTGGNIAAAVTATVGNQYCFAYDPNTARWYPGTGSGSGGGGSGGPTLGLGYKELTVTSSDTTLCSLTIPGGTLKAGAAANSVAATIAYNVKNNTGSADIDYKLHYGASNFSVYGGAISGADHLASTYILANDDGVTNAQTISLTFSNGSFTNTSFANWSEDSTTDLIIKLTGASSGSNQTERVYGCSISTGAGGGGGGGGAVSSVSGTTNQITVTPTTGATVVSIPSSPTLPGTTTLTPAISATGWTAAQHAHAAANSGGNISSTAVASGNKQGTGTKFGMAAGSFTTGNCRSTDASGNEVDDGAPCGGSSTNATQLQSRALAATAPSNGQAIVWNAGGSTWQPGTVSGGGSGNFESLTDCQVAYTSATQLTINGSATSAAPCNIRIGGIVTSFSGPATIDIGTGTGGILTYIKFSSTPILEVAYDGLSGLACSGMSCNLVSSSTYPADGLYIPLTEWLSTIGGAWDATGIPKRAVQGANAVTGGSGVSITPNANGTQAVAVDATVTRTARPYVVEGSNAYMGVATLSSGAATVTTTAVAANSRIFLTPQDCSSTGAIRNSSRTAGTSFVITSSDGASSCVVAWLIESPQ